MLEDKNPSVRESILMGIIELFIIWCQHHKCSLGKIILYVSPKSPPKELNGSPKPCRNDGSEMA